MDGVGQKISKCLSKKRRNLKKIWKIKIFFLYLNKYLEKQLEKKIIIYLLLTIENYEKL